MKEILQRIEDALGGRYAAAELETIKKALCLEYLGISAVSFYTKEKLSADTEKLDRALERLAKGEPLQYVIGSTPFCGLTFRVDGRVLIPRPETAELVDWVADDAAPGGSLLDVGTGSGCIAISLAHRLPGWKVQGWDISDGALEVARENSRLNGTDVEFRKVDILKAEQDCRFDVIVSNPPYVMESEKALMRPNVLQYEPASALFVPDADPLVFYRAVAGWALRLLRPSGALMVEINESLGLSVKGLLEGYGFRNVLIVKDLFGKDRFAKCLL